MMKYALAFIACLFAIPVNAQAPECVSTIGAKCIFVNPILAEQMAPKEKDTDLDKAMRLCHQHRSDVDDKLAEDDQVEEKWAEGFEDCAVIAKEWRSTAKSKAGRAERQKTKADQDTVKALAETFKK